MSTALPSDEPLHTVHDANHSDEATGSDHDRLLAELEEWKDLAHRRTAEIANMQRRAIQERVDLEHHAAERMIQKLLPIFDDLHAAVDASKKTTDITALQQGLEMIYTKTTRIFQDAGVSIIETPSGEPFDVNLHEALMISPSEFPEGHVIQTVQRGYSLHERVLRHAKVITSSGSAQ